MPTTKSATVSAIRTRPCCPYGTDHVADGRRDNGLARGQVLGCLRRADEARRFVARERQQRDVPPGDVCRQLFVRLGAEVVDVDGARQHRGVDLDDRSDDHDLPIGPRGGDARDEVDIHAFVDHAKESETRTRGARLVGRIGANLARAPEVRDVDAARERVNVRVQLALRFVKRLAAGEDDRCATKQLRLADFQRRGRVREGAQLVHAVVHDSVRRQLSGEGERHWCVVPDHVAIDPLLRDQLQHQRTQRTRLLILAGIPGQMRNRHGDAAAALNLQVRPAIRVENGLFDVIHAPLARAPDHQMLGSLKDEIPPEVRETDDVEAFAGHVWVLHAQSVSKKRARACPPEPWRRRVRHPRRRSPCGAHPLSAPATCPL